MSQLIFSPIAAAKGGLLKLSKALNVTNTVSKIPKPQTFSTISWESDV